MSVRRITALVAFLLLAGAAHAQERHQVVRIVDGDTVVLSELGTTRLVGIDTPETVDPRKPVQAFGREASAFLKTLLTGQTVRVEFEPAQGRTDRYGRTLAYLYLADGRLVNREILAAGFGHVYTEFPFAKLEDFRAAEREARTAERGLWADTAPTATDARLVYVMPNSDKYHLKTCRFIKAGATTLRLDETPGHYTACKVCHPPELK